MTTHADIANDEALASRILTYATAQGWTASVHDGEEWTVKSISPTDALPHLGTTDEDTLQFRNADKKIMGRLYLVWGNGSDELINDHTDNDAMHELWNAVIKEETA